MSHVRVDPEVLQRLQDVFADFFEQAERQLQAAAGEIEKRLEELAEERRAAVAALDELDATGRQEELDEARARLDRVEGVVQHFDAAVAEYEDEARVFRTTLDERSGALLGRLHEHVEEYLALQPAIGGRGGDAGRRHASPALGAGLSAGVPIVPFATLEVEVSAGELDTDGREPSDG